MCADTGIPRSYSTATSIEGVSHVGNTVAPASTTRPIDRWFRLSYGFVGADFAVSVRHLRRFCAAAGANTDKMSPHWWTGSRPSMDLAPNPLTGAAPGPAPDAAHADDIVKPVPQPLPVDCGRTCPPAPRAPAPWTAAQGRQQVRRTLCAPAIGRGTACDSGCGAPRQRAGRAPGSGTDRRQGSSRGHGW